VWHVLAVCRGAQACDPSGLQGRPKPTYTSVAFFGKPHLYRHSHEHQPFRAITGRSWVVRDEQLEPKLGPTSSVRDHAKPEPRMSLSRAWRREVDPPIEVKTATWSKAGQLDWWVKDRQEWWGRVRGADGRQRWIRAVDLRPVEGELTRDFQISPGGPRVVHGLLIIVYMIFPSQRGHRLWERIASNW
jgi:hypothetical protein